MSTFESKWKHWTPSRADRTATTQAGLKEVHARANVPAARTAESASGLLDCLVTEGVELRLDGDFPACHPTRRAVSADLQSNVTANFDASVAVLCAPNYRLRPQEVAFIARVFTAYRQRGAFIICSYPDLWVRFECDALAGPIVLAPDYARDVEMEAMFELPTFTLLRERDGKGIGSEPTASYIERLAQSVVISTFRNGGE